MTNRTLFGANRKFLMSVAAVVLLSGCTQTKIVDSWQTDKPVVSKPEKVAVIVVLPDGLARKAVEIDIVKIMRDKGTPAVAGSNIPGMSGGIRGEIDTDVATEMLRSAGADGVVVLFYSGGANSEGYVRSDYWAQNVGTYMGGGWGRPYMTGMTQVYTIRQGPGWADYRMSALVESSYYDLKTLEPAWRIVTETKDTEHADAAADIARKIASEMSSAGLN